ncbi:MAG: GtrA family protein [Pirellulales bacterium]
MRRFLVIGSSSVVIDYAAYCLLAGPLAVEMNLAKGISYVIGMAFGFVGNKYWTFGSARRSATEPFSYLALYLVTLAVNIGVNGLVLAALGRGATLLAFLVATGTTTVLNFLGMRLVTFRQGISARLEREEAVQQSRAEPVKLRAAGVSPVENNANLGTARMPVAPKTPSAARPKSEVRKIA